METNYFDTYENLVKQAGAFHGDICHGIRIGTRMTMSGLRRIGIVDPKGADRKKLMVFVEIDRCTTDAIMALTGCRPGKRTMKIRDYGKMAATFINLETRQAFRVAVKGNRKQGESNGGEEPDFATLPEEELFAINEVEVALRPEDMPGKPLRRIPCARCGEIIMDGREVPSGQGQQVLCVPCASAADYYRIAD